MEKISSKFSLNKAIERADNSKFITEDATNALVAIYEFPDLNIKIDNSLEQLMNIDMEDLIDDDANQITESPILLSAFKNSSKKRRYFKENKISELYKYVIYLYNDTIQVSDKYGALTYLQKISESLDFLEVSNIMELSLEQLLLVLQYKGRKMKYAYNKIKENRHCLTDLDFNIYCNMLNKNNKFSSKEAKVVYEFIRDIYNSNTIIQDNIKPTQYLRKFASLNQKKVISMRMLDILKVFNIHKINYENINESKNLLNDCAEICNAQ